MLEQLAPNKLQKEICQIDIWAWSSIWEGDHFGLWLNDFLIHYYFQVYDIRV